MHAVKGIKYARRRGSYEGLYKEGLLEGGPQGPPERGALRGPPERGALLGGPRMRAPYKVSHIRGLISGP